MGTQDVRTRVVVASERPEVRSIIGGIAERRDHAIVVGEAPNAGSALFLARQLRPDVVMVDSSLPHIAGIDAVPMSRIGGLDAAQTIANEVPDARVVLIGNLDTEVSAGQRRPANSWVILASDGTSPQTPLTLRDLRTDADSPNQILFASVRVWPEEPVRLKAGSVADKLVLFGALTLALGWALLITMVFAPVGVFIASAGAVAVALGLAGKMIASWRRRRRSRQAGTA